MAVLAVAAVTALVWLTSRGQPSVAWTPPPGVALGEQTMGDPNAPVTLTEYADYQCPFCANAENGVVQEIQKTYVADGRVRLVFRDFAFLGDESIWAAQAAACAGEQGQFWPYHHLLFNQQAGENRGAFARDKLKGFAGQLGLDQATFASCLDTDRTLARVQSETAEGRTRGVRSTPTFYVNDQQILGARSIDVFRQAIEAELAKKK